MSRKTRYPLGTFLKKYSSEENCYDYLVQLRWASGFVCPKCGHNGSGKRTTLLPFPPLRTVRESFPSHGSSFSKIFCYAKDQVQSNNQGHVVAYGTLDAP